MKRSPESIGVKTKIILAVFLVSMCNFAFAQNIDWVSSIKGNLEQYGHRLSINQQEEIIMVGSVQDTSIFDPSGTNKPVATNGNYDPYVAKYSKDGSLVWVRSFGGDSIDYCNDVTLDPAGNIYITGLYRYTLIIPTLSGIDTLTSKGERDCFVIKLNTLGDVIWTKSIGSTGYENGQGIVADNFNNLYLTGYYEDSLEINPGVYLLPTDEFVMFLMKLDALTGKIYWGKSMKRSYDARKSDGTGNIELGSDGNIYISASLTQRHLTKYDTSGQLLWPYTWGRTNFTFRSNGVTSDTLGHVYTIGGFTGTMNFSGS